MIACNHQRCALMCRQIFDQCIEPCIVSGTIATCRVYSQCRSYCSCKSLDLTGFQWQAMIGKRSRVRWGGFNGIDPIHIGLLAIDDLAAQSNVTSVSNTCRTAFHKIGVQRQDAFGFFEMILRFDHLAQSHSGTFAHVVARAWLKLMPSCVGIFFQ